MPKGLKKIEQLAADANKRREQYDAGGDWLRPLKLQKGHTARGRFLEEGENIWYLYVHELPKKPGQRYGDRVLCLDQDDQGVECPGCRTEGVSRGTRVVINFLRYDEPKLRRDAQKKPVKDAQGNYVFDGVEPQVVVWNAPTGVGGRLSFLESEHGPLTQHVCTIHRTNDDKNPWMIDVAEKGKTPEPWEHELYNKKTEPNIAITRLGVYSIPEMSYGDMKRAYSGASVGAGFAQPSGGDGQPAPSDNIYEQAARGSGHMNLGAFGS